MYQLYCARNTYAMGAHVLLEELGVAYEICEVDLGLDQQSDDFMLASPHGRVPALRYSHGAIFESNAIALYLTDTHADRGLSIVPDHSLRAPYLQWLFYLSSTVQPEVLIQFHPEYYFTDVATQTVFRNASMERLLAIWQILDMAYATDPDSPWLFDQRPTAVDFCLAIQIQWSECFDDTIDRFPYLAGLLRAMKTRPAFEKVMRWHQ